MTSPFTIILLVLGLTVGIVDDSMLVAWGFFLLATINEALRVWAARPAREEERFEG